MDLKIIKVSDEDWLSQLIRPVWHVLIQLQCIRKENMKILCYGKRKKLISKQLQCSTQEVQYVEETIEERSRLQKEI